MKTTERRGMERFDLELPARICVLAPEERQREMELRTANISSGGAFFHTPQPLPEGTEVKVDLVLDLERLKALSAKAGHVHIQLKGKVVRTEEAGMSVCFSPDYQIRSLGSG